METPDIREKLLFMQTAEGFSGYKQSLLLTELTPIEESFLICAKCKGIMRDACTINEGMLQACLYCIEITEAAYQSLASARKSVLELAIMCPLHMRGCDWKGKICDLTKHVDECLCFMIECSLGCGMVLQRCDVTLHENTDCAKLKVECNLCQRKVSSAELPLHQEECRESLVECRNACGMQIKLGEAAAHLKSECMNSVHDCSYVRYGCGATQLRRQQLGEHMRENSELHTALFNASIASTQKDLLDRITRLEETDRQKSVQMEELAKQNTKLGNKVRYLNAIVMTSLIGTALRWKITGFGSDAIHYESPGFALEGYAFKCSILLEDVKLHVKLSTVKGAGDKTVKWPFRGKSIVVLVNQDRENESLHFEGEDGLELARNFYEGTGDSVNQNKKICTIPIASVIRDPYCKKGTVLIYVLLKSCVQ